MAAGNDLEYWKARFIAYWSQAGRNSFPKELKRQYLQEMKDKAPPQSGILLNMADDTEKADSILQILLPFDPKLGSFKEFVKLYESLSPKAFQFLKSPELSEATIKKLKGMEAKENWKLEKPGEWTIRSVSQSNGRTRITVAKESSKILTAKLTPSDVTEMVYESILEKAKQSIPGASRIQNVKVSVVAPNVFQFSIDFDWKSDTVEIESDLKDWAEESNKVDLRSIRKEALGVIAKDAGIKGIAGLDAVVSSPEPVDEKLHSKIEKIQSKDELVIIRGGRFHVAGEGGYNDEELTANLGRFTSQQLALDCKAYYREYKKLGGFLSKHQSYNRERTQYQKALKEKGQESCHGYFVKVYPKILSKAELEKQSVPDAFEIEVVIFQYDNETGDWDIRTPAYSRRVRDDFLLELHSLSQKPAKPKAPTIGRSTQANIPKS